MSVPLRITHSMMSDRLLGDIRRASSDMARTSAQVSSGKRISSASDDPLGAARSMRLRAEIEETKANINGTGAATGWMNAADAALGSINDIVHRTRELLVKAGSDTLQPSDRAAIADELGQLLDQVKANANARYGDQYIFSGQSSDVAPYALGPVDTYNGDALAVMRTVGPGQSVQVNVPGEDVLGGVPGDGQLLDTMRTAIARLTSGVPADMDALRTDSLQRIDANLDTVLQARTQLGVTNSRVQLAEQRFKEIQLVLTKELSDVKDTDAAKALISLTSQQTAFQAALSSGAKVIQPSLMDFLR